MPNTPPRGYKVLAGSERKQLANTRPVAPVNPNEQIEVSVYLREPATSNLSQMVSQGRRLTRKEYVESHSASSEDIAKVEQFARDHDLTIVENDPVTRKVVLTGTAAALSSAFATELHYYETPGGRFRGRTGPLHIPNGLDQVIVGVFGLDDRPQAKLHLRRYQPKAGTAAAPATSYTPPQLAKLYNFPTNANGAGQCIGIIELGGGFKQKDLQTYFQQLGVPLPKVTSISVDGGRNHAVGSPDSADGEVVLDIEVAAGVAPSAHIAVYFAPNTDRGFVDAITQAIHDGTNSPSVISISWGSAEIGWTPQAVQAMDQAFQAAAALGVTICSAAGDSGSSDMPPGGPNNDGKAHVDFPASDPYVLGCGGTRLTATSEAVWNDGPDSATGGGVSDIFGLPTWQANAKVPPSVNDQHIGRGVPDVAGDADPQTGYQIHVDGQDIVLGGTSAVAPLWAGLIALINQQRGQSVGYLNPTLYQNYTQLAQASALRNITQGNNGAYAAGPGWNACTGLGSPNGTNLLEALQKILRTNTVPTS
jgi:kumamolisin